MTIVGTPLICGNEAQAQTFYWNGANVSSSPAAGGTGTWNTPSAWRTGSPTGSEGTWSASTLGTNHGFLGGTAGTITLGTSGSVNFTGSQLTVNSNGYAITTSSASRNIAFTGALNLADNVGLTLTNSAAGGNLNSFGTINFGTGSSLSISGSASAINANRVNLTSASTITGGIIRLAGTGDGVTGFASTASIASGGVLLNANIVNNSSSSATMLGAGSGNLLTYGGNLSGSANLQISAGQSGGMGIVVLSGTNSYAGDTYLNAGTNGVTRIGVDNTLPSGTTVFFGASAGGGTPDNGGSIDLNGRDLSVGGLEKTSNPNQGIANNTSTLSTITIGKESGTNNFNGIIGTVTNSNLTSQTNNIAVIKNGGSTQIFSGANTYTGGTTVSQGTLQLSGSGTLGANTNTLTVNGGTMDFNGQSRTIGSLAGTGGSITSTSAATLTVGNGGASGANASAITGDLSLVKNGIGTQTLSGANSYSGTTTINAGTLLVNGSHTGGGAYTVNAGGTLGGTGTVTANVNLVGGTLSAGNSIGAMTLGGLTFNTLSAESTLLVEFNSSLVNNNVVFADFMTVGGAVNLNNVKLTLIDLGNAFSPIGSSFTFLSASSVTGTFSNFADGDVANIGSNQWRINYGTSSISFSAVPEPSSLALLVLVGISGIAFRRLRSKKNQLLEIVG